MFNNSFKIMFMLILISGTLITVSSNSWLSAWMGLEINLLAFIPLMNDNNLMSTESSLKYFLTQALASTVFLFSGIFLLMENFYLNNIYHWTKMLILMSLLLKTGAAPFHFWFPSVMQGLSWMNSLILMTWQKLAPFLLMSYMINKSMIIMSAMLSSIFGALGGLNQTSMFKLMAYSSIGHMGWMLIAMLKNEFMWLIYFLFYSFLSMTMIMMFYIFNIFNINQLFLLSLKSKTMKFILLFNLLSLGGLPPFLGFIPKFLIVQYLTNMNQMFILTILIFSTLITLFFYLRVCYVSFMLNYKTINWNMNLYFNQCLMNYYLICSSISILGLLLISFIFMF